MKHVIPFLSGLLFGLGLLLSGMNDPQKVRGFLDIFGNWQPELIAVMGGAVVTFFIVLFRLVINIIHIGFSSDNYYFSKYFR